MNPQNGNNAQDNAAENLSSKHLSRDAQEVLNILLSLLRHDAEDFAVPEFLKDNWEFSQIHTILMETQRFCDSLREGKLEHKTSAKSYSIGQLKAIQMELRNLVWQMQEVANGNSYISSVITGEISESFNSMIERLNLTIQEIRQISKNYEEISSRDPLTGCYNRNALKKEFLNTIAKAYKNKQCCGLFMLDLDHFKNINDTYGHHTGDMVLKQFVRKIYDTIRDTDLCCRMGGEEFAILFPNTSGDILMKIDERLRRNIAEIKIQRKDSVITVTHSAGIALFTPQQMDEAALSKLISFTDKLLYQAKENGRNCSVFAEYSVK